MANPKPADERPELSPEEVEKRVWSNPGGEELALREAKTGTDADVDNQSDAVARETPGDTVERISDPHLDESGKASAGNAARK